MFAQQILGTQELYQTVLNHLSDGVFLLDQQRCVWVWNGAAERITGYTQDEMIGSKSWFDALDHMDSTGVPLAAGENCPVRATLRDGRRRVNELFLRHKKGYRVPVLAKTLPIVEREKIVAVMGVFSDNSVHVRKNDVSSSLNRLVMTDFLTGLSNKRHSELLLETRLDDYQRYGVRFGTLFIGLDDIDICKSRYGYEACNTLLATLAEKITSSIRESDFLGRWSGESFLGAFELRSPESLKPVAEKIRVLIEQTFINLHGEEIHTTASIGATMANTGDSVQQLIERTVSLMHVSKICGKNCATTG